MEYIFTIPVEDVQYLANKKFGRELDIDELEQVKKGVKFSLECWKDVVKYAMDDLEVK